MPLCDLFLGSDGPNESQELQPQFLQMMVGRYPKLSNDSGNRVGKFEPGRLSHKNRHPRSHQNTLFSLILFYEKF